MMNALRRRAQSRSAFVFHAGLRSCLLGSLLLTAPSFAVDADWIGSRPVTGPIGNGPNTVAVDTARSGDGDRRDESVRGPNCTVAIQNLANAVGDLSLTNTFWLSGELTIFDPPLTGDLYVRVEGGPSQVFSAPFGATESFLIQGLYADGATRTVEAEFTDDAGCNDSTSFVAPTSTFSTILDLGFAIPDLSWDNSPTNARTSFQLIGPNGSLGNIPSGTFDLDTPNANASKVLTNHAAFCIELSQSISANTTYTDYVVEPLETAPSVAGSNQGLLIPATGIGRVKAGMVRWLFDNHYDGTAIGDWTNATGGSFQLALWDITHDHYSDNVSQNVVTAVAGTFYTSTNNQARTNAQAILDQLNALNWTDAEWESYVSQLYHVVYLESPTIQDQVLGIPMNSTGVPVTLGWFDSRASGSGVQVRWATQTEVGNVGFRLYGETGRGQWLELGDELIASPVGDSVEPQFYSASVRARDLQRLYLEDVDVFGKSTVHGPFEVGQSFGKRPAPQAIDWQDARLRALDRQRNQRSDRPWQPVAGDPIRLSVDQDGIQRVYYDDLVAAGANPGMVPISAISLSNQGYSVPFHSAARDWFGPGEYIEFYGRANDSQYSRDNVYLLRFNAPTRLAQADSKRPGGDARSGHAADRYTEVLRFGEQRVYSPTSFIGTPWFHSRITVVNNPVSRDYAFTVDQLAAGQSSLSLSLFGITEWPDADIDHHVEVYLNGSLLADERFYGRVARNLDLTLSEGLLVEGNNTLTLRLPGDTGVPAAVIGFQGFELSYPRHLSARSDEQLHFSGAAAAFEVDNLAGHDAVVYSVGSPLGRGEALRIDAVRVTGEGPYRVWFAGIGTDSRYVIADESTLLSPRIERGWSSVDITSGRADYLIISHPAFADALGDLIAHHQSLGRVVRVVETDDIYDQFGHGLFDPAAIRDYLRATASNMGYRHVLLVGGDTYDYQDHLGLGSISFIPSLYAKTGELVHFAPADPLLVDLDGDQVGDLPIGRLPVRDTTELATVIAKTLAYVNRWYDRSAVLTADQQEPGVSYRSILDQLASNGMQDWSLSRAYLDELPVDSARASLFGAINDGVSLTAYLGHSAHTVWSFSGLFSAADVAGLSNFGRPTAVAQWGCWNTYHVGPSYDTLGHAFLLTPDRGAALVMGSTTFSHVQSGQRLGERLLPLLTTPGITAGEALMQAQQAMARDFPQARDAIVGWTLLGDPAIEIGR